MKNNLQAFLVAQKAKIEKDKWNEGIKLNKDPGQSYIINWISQNGGWFRLAWEKSLCNSCSSANVCGYKVKQICECFDNSIIDSEE